MSSGMTCFIIGILILSLFLFPVQGYARVTRLEIDISHLSTFASGNLTLSYGFEDRNGNRELAVTTLKLDKGFKLKVDEEEKLSTFFDDSSRSIMIEVSEPKKTWWVKIVGRFSEGGSIAKVPAYVDSGEYPSQILVSFDGIPKDALECISGSCSKYLFLDVKKEAPFSIELKANGPLFYPVVPEAK